MKLFAAGSLSVSTAQAEALELFRPNFKFGGFKKVGFT